MPKPLRARGLRLNPKGLKHNIGKRTPLIPERHGLGQPPDAIHNLPVQIHPSTIRNTQFRLPYLSNLKKMDPVFDDPYDVAAQTIGKTRRPGDPDIILDPDGIYERDDMQGSSDFQDFVEDGEEDTGPPPKIHDSFEETMEKQRFQSLLETTGMTLQDINRLQVRNLVYNFVSNQTRGGKIQNVFALTVVGDGNGMLGFGQGKWDVTEAETARDKAMIQAIQSMAPIHRYENRTVYGDIEAKFKSTTVSLRPKAPGFGIRANYYVHEVCRCAGITDLGAKVRGSMNGMNIVKAVVLALRGQKLPETIARQRGMHVVDVRQRYFNGR